MDTPEISFSFRLPVAIKYDDKARCFVSYCAPLDVYSAGKTEDEAHAAIVSAVHMFVSLCFQRNILDDFLTKRGFSIEPRMPLANVRRTQPVLEQPTWFIALHEFGGRRASVDVPFPLFSTNSGGAKGGEACLA